MILGLLPVFVVFVLHERPFVREWTGILMVGGRGWCSR